MDNIKVLKVITVTRNSCKRLKWEKSNETVQVLGVLDKKSIRKLFVWQDSSSLNKLSIASARGGGRTNLKTLPFPLSPTPLQIILSLPPPPCRLRTDRYCRAGIAVFIASCIRPEHVNWVIVKDKIPVTSFQGIWNRVILETRLVSCDHAMCIHELVIRALSDTFTLPNCWRNFTYYKQEEYTNCILNDTVTFCSSHLYCRGTPSSCCISLQWGGSSHHLQALVNQKDYEISYNSDTYKTVSSDTLNNIQSAPST